MAPGCTLLELEIERGVARHDLEDLQRLANDFGADPVTLENQNLVRHLCLRSPGRRRADRVMPTGFRADSLKRRALVAGRTIQATRAAGAIFPVRYLPAGEA